jgi:hypothetical protein
VKTKTLFVPSLNFTWRRAVGGYHWIDTGQDRRLCAVDSSQPDWSFDQERYIKEYHPLEEHSGLFLEFTALDATEESIRQFANRFGLLGARLDPRAGAVLVAHQAQPEPFQLWKREIEELGRAILRWRMVATGNRNLLRKLKRKLASQDTPLAVQNYRHVNDKDPAMFFLSAIQHDTDTRLTEHVLTRVLFAGNTPRLNVVLQPQSLLGCLWLQFAAAVDSKKAFAKCRQCDVPFEVSRDPSGKRRSARFCSDRCRVAHYRGRIDTARRLKDEGTPLSEIARALHTKISTVRGWVEEDYASTAG